MSEYTQAFFTIPYRIMQLPDLTIQLLKFYETIFHFWHTGNECFLTNEALKERAVMKSDSTIASAFQYFEKHGEMKRVMKGSRRYIVQTIKAVETDSVDKSHENGTNISQGLATARGGSRCSGGGGLATARHNNNNINNININKSSCEKDEKKNKDVYNTAKQTKADWKEANQKKPTWATQQKDSPRADVSTQSNSFNADTYRDLPKFNPNGAGYQSFVDSVPSLRRKKARKATELLAGTGIQPETSSTRLSDSQGASIDDGRLTDSPSRIRSSDGLLAARRVCSLSEKTGMAG